MSYLNNLRLVFAGDFQADVSTVNNDVRHYDNVSFEKRFQQPFENEYDKDQVISNGYWNPVGSGAFRLINCTVQSVYYQDGSSATEPNHDRSVGLYIGGSNNRVGAKLVDLDPQWQFSSQIWGLTIRLSDSSGNDLLVSQFEPAAFRDIWLGRQQGDIAPLDQTASAAFQSVLTNLQWSQDLSASRFLQELKEATEAAEEKEEDRRLSIRLTTFGYKKNPKVNRFTLGRLVGVIGLYTPNEPHSFVLGRRMVPKLNANGNPIHNINFFDCQVDEQNHTVSVDLGNALPFTIENENKDNEHVKLEDLGTLQLAVLCAQDNKYPYECETVTKGKDFIPLGSEIIYQHDKDPDWLNRTAGIWSAKIPKEHYSSVLKQPLAIIKISNSNDGKGEVLIRESEDGLLIRAEEFVQRAEPGYTVNVALFATRYGQPLPNANVQISLAQPDNDSGMSYDGQNPPKAPSPYTNIPASAVILPSTLITDNEGKAVLSVGTSNPNNPRVYIDGQLYRINYQLEKLATEQQHSLDCVILLLYNAYQVTEQPTWIDHIKPIFQQYANLYPIMSQRLVNLSDYDSVKKHRAILELAFSRDPSDPNYMPVSRDLSAPKRMTILKWLRQQNLDGQYTLFYGCVPVDQNKQIVPPPQVELADEATCRPQTAKSQEIGNKTRFYKNFK